uniref:Uncharacterized protein n=1 Tax=Hyaloperonospora arabidopsidis (strain Emoy2) TaxID=559515 RepID=M4B504_HYAAE
MLHGKHFKRTANARASGFTVPCSLLQIDVISAGAYGPQSRDGRRSKASSCRITLARQGTSSRTPAANQKSTMGRENDDPQ